MFHTTTTTTTTTNNTTATNTRAIPSVGTSSRRLIPTPRSNNSAIERKLDEVVQELDTTKRSLELYQTKFDHLSADHEELKAKFNNKPAADNKHGFPGSKVELKQIRVSINTCWFKKIIF